MCSGFFLFHKWTKWSDAYMRKESFYSSVQKKEVVGNAEIQHRVCERCNKKQERYV